MTINLKPLQDQRRLLIEAGLQPVQGKRFQPTGFPDLGPATYQAGGTACLLVESPQSMANRLEETIWDAGANQPTEVAAGISYVVVNDTDGEHLTSSIQAAHRMNSVYIEKSEGDFFSKTFADAIGADKNRPLNRSQFAKALFTYDINSLLHGIFLESLDGRLRFARSMSAFIEAEEVSTVASGGAKLDSVQATTKDESKTAKDGFGNVIFHREEFTSEKITAFFSVDLQQIRAYGLGHDATHLLIVLALYKIRSLLDGDMRLRTACDFEAIEIKTTRPTGFEIPAERELANELKSAIKKCSKEMQTTTTVFKK